MQGGQLRLQLRGLRPLVVVLQDLNEGRRGSRTRACEEGKQYKRAKRKGTRGHGSTQWLPRMAATCCSDLLQRIMAAAANAVGSTHPRRGGGRASSVRRGGIQRLLLRIRLRYLLQHLQTGEEEYGWSVNALPPTVGRAQQAGIGRCQECTCGMH